MARRRERRDTDWPGIIALVLAIGLAVGFAGGLIFEASPWTNSRISDESAALLSTLGGAMAGAVATYLGVGRRDQARREEHEEHEDQK